MTLIALSYKPPLESIIREASRRGLITAIEITPDHYAFEQSTRSTLKGILNDISLPYSLHFVSNSPVSADFPENSYCATFSALVEELSPLLVSDHLTCCRSGDIDLDQNVPVIRTDETLEIAIENLRRLKKLIAPKCPIAIENIAHHFDTRRSTISHVDFYRSAVVGSDSEFLLDLHNLYVDELNFGLDAENFIEALPGERIAEIHLAGGGWKGNTYFDFHNSEVPPRVFELLEFTLRRSKPRLVVIERDTNFVQLEGLLVSLEQVQAYVEKFK